MTRVYLHVASVIPDILKFLGPVKQNFQIKIVIIFLPICLTLYLIETPFNTFANRVEPDQTALIRPAFIWSTLFAYGNIISTVPPTKSDIDKILCLQLLSKTLTNTPLEQSRIERSHVY